MGCNPFLRGSDYPFLGELDCSPPSVLTQNSVNPDPSSFRVKKVYTSNGLFVSLVNYPNCTTFEGNKILVTTYDVREKIKLDPHFHNGSGLIARFEPTDTGWEAAVWFVTNVT